MYIAMIYNLFRVTGKNYVSFANHKSKVKVAN